MPRQPKVPHCELLEAILKTDGVLDSDFRLPGPTQEPWPTIANKLKNELTPGYIHLFVKQNRHGALQAVCDKHGVPLERVLQVPSHHMDDSQEGDQGEAGIDDDDEAAIGAQRPVKEFTIIISATDWERMKPITTTYNCARRGTKKVKILPPSK